MIFPILELRPAKTSLGRFAFRGARMFDAEPEVDDDDANPAEEAARAVAHALTDLLIDLVADAMEREASAYRNGLADGLSAADQPRKH